MKQKNKNDEFEKKFNDVLNGFVKKVNDVTKDVVTVVAGEKEKAQIRSEIGHNTRDLSRAYEKLGREYYASVKEGKELNCKDTFELIRSKELLISLLNEKLEGMSKTEEKTEE